VSFMAFIVSVKSVDCASHCDATVLVDTCDVESQDEEINFQDAYNQLYKECAKMKILNKLTLKKLNEVELENESFNAKLYDLHAILYALKTKYCMLMDKVKSLEGELVVADSHFSTSGDKLACILNVQKNLRW
jgi:predicted nuclease with TOPRIM domain